MNYLGMGVIFGIALSTPAIGRAGVDTLDGRYAYYQAATSAETDKGPRDDADCQRFFASDLYQFVSEYLTITGTRWDDHQDVSAVTGNVVMGKSSGKVTPFTINVESEASNNSGGGVTLRKGTVTRNGNLAISIRIEEDHGTRVLHYCKVN